MNKPSADVDADPDAYDRVPYTSFTYAFTHPDRLETLGRLFGLSPAPAGRCRVLELGCASGANLMAMAELLPNSEFLGVDRSSRQIEAGKALAASLELPGLELRRADILELDAAALGSFDYVICHGVFTWVPRPVQDRILAVIAELLAPQGLAIISYNVYPGWHMREMIRHMMAYHVAQFGEPEKKVEQARALVEFLGDAVAARLGDQAGGDPYALLVERERGLIAQASDPYLFHEHLERDNHPLYFHQFVERLEGLPLRYLCDTDLHLMDDRELPASVRETLARITGDQISREQYLDFVRNRQFRTSVICRRALEPRRRIGPEVARRLRFAIDGQAPEAVELREGVELHLEISGGPSISSADALTKAAMVELVERWPASLGFDELVLRAHARLEAAGLRSETRPETLASSLLESMLHQAVIARSHEPPLASSPGSPEKPRVSAFNRHMARDEAWITGHQNRRMKIGPVLAKLVPLLDGSRDRAALVDALLAEVDAGEIELQRDGATLDDRQACREALGEFVDGALEQLHRLPALLPAQGGSSAGSGSGPARGTSR